MARLLLLTNAMTPSSDVLPALALLGHQVRVASADVSVLIDAPPTDAVLVDARRDDHRRRRAGEVGGAQRRGLDGYLG